MQNDSVMGAEDFLGKGFFFLFAKLSKLTLTFIQKGAFYFPLEVNSLLSPIVSYPVDTASTGRGIASSPTVSTQQGKNVMELIMDLITSHYQ